MVVKSMPTSSLSSHKVNELADICNYNRKTKHMVLKRLKTGVDAMFLWVSLITSKLLETSPNAVEETLQASPTDSMDGMGTSWTDSTQTQKTQKWQGSF